MGFMGAGIPQFQLAPFMLFLGGNPQSGPSLAPQIQIGSFFRDMQSDIGSQEIAIWSGL